MKAVRCNTQQQQHNSNTDNGRQSTAFARTEVCKLLARLTHTRMHSHTRRMSNAASTDLCQASADCSCPSTIPACCSWRVQTPELWQSMQIWVKLRGSEALK